MNFDRKRLLELKHDFEYVSNKHGVELWVAKHEKYCVFKLIGSFNSDIKTCKDTLIDLDILSKVYSDEMISSRKLQAKPLVTLIEMKSFAPMLNIKDTQNICVYDISEDDNVVICSHSVDGKIAVSEDKTRINNHITRAVLRESEIVPDMTDYVVESMMNIENLPISHFSNVVGKYIRELYLKINRFLDDS